MFKNTVQNTQLCVLSLQRNHSGVTAESSDLVEVYRSHHSVPRIVSATPILFKDQQLPGFRFPRQRMTKKDNIFRKVLGPIHPDERMLIKSCAPTTFGVSLIAWHIGRICARLVS
jgi:hypothetical protein